MARIYFSHSYRDVDKDVNSFFLEIMKELSWEIAVDPSSPTILYEKIAKHIEDSKFVVVIVTCREFDKELNAWLPSPWISQEIGMAMMARKPLIVFVEEGVSVTDVIEEVHYYRFSRKRLDDDKSLIRDRLSKFEDSVSTSYTYERHQDPFAFVVMKFDDQELEDAYELAIKPAITASGLKSVRVDEVSIEGTITDEIIRLIKTCTIVIADLTGERPNCYYEIGFAHALGRPVILSIKKGEKIHFDLVARQFLIWNNMRKLRSELELRIKRILKKDLV